MGTCLNFPAYPQIHILTPSLLLSYLVVLANQPSSSWVAPADRTPPPLCSCTVGTWWWCLDRAASCTTLFPASSQRPRDIQLQRWKAAAWAHPCRTALWCSRCQRRTGRCAPGTFRAPEWMWLSDRCWGLGRASHKHPLLTKGLMQDSQEGTMMTQTVERQGKGRGVAVTLLIPWRHDTDPLLWHSLRDMTQHLRPESSFAVLLNYLSLCWNAEATRVICGVNTGSVVNICKYSGLLT